MVDWFMSVLIYGEHGGRAVWGEAGLVVVVSWVLRRWERGERGGG